MEDSFNKILFKAKCIKPIIFKLFFNLIKEPIRDIAFHLTKSGIESKHYDIFNNIQCILNLHENKFEDYYIDYIFTDPPFGSNLNYSELNSLPEPWLKVITNNGHEAIENKAQGKTEQTYR